MNTNELKNKIEVLETAMMNLTEEMDSFIEFAEDAEHESTRKLAAKSIDEMFCKIEDLTTEIGFNQNELEMTEEVESDQLFCDYCESTKNCAEVPYEFEGECSTIILCDSPECHDNLASALSINDLGGI